MNYFIQTSEGYIIAIGTTDGEGNCTEEKYTSILSAVEEKPEAPNGKQYRLKEDDLSWVLTDVIEQSLPSDLDIKTDIL